MAGRKGGEYCKQLQTLNFMRKQLILIGGGGHCKSCIDVIEQEGKFDIHGILDSPEKVGDQLLGYNYIGTDDDIESFIEKGYYFLVTIGQLKSAEKRRNIFDRLKAGNAGIATIISPLVHVSKHAVIGEGTIVMNGAMVNADARIGHNCILNTGANIEHDTVIGNHCHISTHAVVNGNCKLGDEIFIGSNAVLSNGVEIVSGIILGAGSVIIKSLKTKGIYAGIPAKMIHE